MDRYSTRAIVSHVVVLLAIVAPVAVDAGEVVIPGGVVEDMVADPVRNDLYASLASVDEIVKVSFDTAAVTARITVPGDPELLAIAPDGSRLYVTLEDSYEVVVYDLPGLTYLSTYDLSVYSLIGGIAAGSTRLYVYAGGSLSIVDLTTDTEIFWGTLNPSHGVDKLLLGPHEVMLFSINFGSTNRAWIHDVSGDAPVHVGENCFGCLGEHGDDAAVSPDGSLLYFAASDPSAFLQAHSVPEAGHLVEQHSILTGYHPTAVATSPDGSTVYVGIWGDDHVVAAVRTSDWLPYRLESLVHFVHEESFVVSTNGESVATVADGAFPNRIEIVDFAGLMPNRGGVRLRPVEYVDGVPTTIASAEITGGPFRSGCGWLDFPSGVLGLAPLEAGHHDFDLTAAGYESQAIGVTIVPGQWTDLGEVTLVRTGSFPAPDQLCAGEAAASGATSTVLFRGRGFHPLATLSSENSEVTVDDFTWIDWSTIEATVTVDPGVPTGSEQDLRVVNPGGPDDYGYLFVLAPGPSNASFSDGAFVTEEDATTVNVEVRREGDVQGVMSVDWATSDDSATAGQDYIADSGTLTWLEGESLPHDITLSILQDASIEGNESFTLELSNVVGGELGQIAQTAVTVLDDDVSYLQFSTSELSVVEDSGLVQVTVTRSGKMDVAVTVDYATTDGSAVSPDDFAPIAGTLSWGVGDNSSRVLDISIVNEGIPEGNEAFSVTLSNPSALAVLGESSTAAVTVIEDDVSTVQFSAAAFVVDEVDGSIRIPVSRSVSHSGEVSVDYTTFDGSATAPDDYTATSGTLTWSSWNTFDRFITVEVNTDWNSEVEETISIVLGNPAGSVVLGDPATATLSIHDEQYVMPVGDEFQINIETQGYQVDPRVAVDYFSGGYFVVWGDRGDHIKAAVVPEVGDVISEELTVFSAPAEGSVFMPSVAIDGSGRGVVVWSGYEDWWANPNGRISGRLFSNGEFDAEDLRFRISQDTNWYSHRFPDVGIDDFGRFAVFWQQADWPWGSWIKARGYDHLAVPFGDEFEVRGWRNSGETWGPWADVNSSGEVVVSYVGPAEVRRYRLTPISLDALTDSISPIAPDSDLDSSFLPSAIDESSVSVMTWREWPDEYLGRFMAPSGEFPGEVQTFSNRFDLSRDVAMDSAGNFVAVGNVWARVFSADGTPMGDEFRISDVTAYDPQLPQVALTDDGEFLVVWETRSEEDVDGDSSAVFGRRFQVDFPPVIALESAVSSVGETDGTVTVSVRRTGSSDGFVSVDYVTSGVTAAEGIDFTGVSGTLTWSNGDSTDRTVQVPIFDDAAPEGDEAFLFTLTNVVDGTLGRVYEAVVTIVDDDISYLQLTAETYQVDEAGGTAQLTVTRAGGTESAVTVDYATADGTAIEPDDYGSSAGTLSWGAGDDTSRIIEVPIVDDDLFEGNEIFTVTLGDPSAAAILGQPSEADVTIVDNDLSLLMLASSTYVVNERDASVTVEVLRGGSTAGAVTVDFSTADVSASAGSDYTGVSGTVSWADGDGAPKSFAIPILEDTLTEGDETVTISLSNPIGTAIVYPPASAVLTIMDNDSAGLQFSNESYQALETDGSIQILVRRVGDTAGAASVNYATSDGSATAGADYEDAAGTLSWADGDGADKSFAVNLVDDSLTEFAESFAVVLSNPTGNASLADPATATIRINDDESIETRVNTTVEYAQVRPRIAASATGASVVVWDSWKQDGWGWGVYGQRMNSAGDPVGSEFQVNIATDEDQMNAAVAMAPGGRFTVVWQAAVGGGTGIYARRYNAVGAPLGDEIVVNSSASGSQTVPRVAFDGNGRFMVVWQARDASGPGVFARVYGTDGAPLDTEFVVNTTTAASQGSPDVAGFASGGFVVVWESYGQDVDFTDAVIGRRFASNGTPLGGEVLVNVSTAGNQSSPAVAVALNGSFLVVWEDDSGLDGAFASIRGRWFDAAASPITGGLQINAYTAGDQGIPAAAAASHGRAMVVWEGRSDQDGSESGVFARALYADGSFASAEIQLNTYTSDSQDQPAVACSGAERSFGVWRSEGQDGPPLGADGVYGISWPLPPTQLIFADGFESGDTAAW